MRKRNFHRDFRRKSRGFRTGIFLAAILAGAGGVSCAPSGSSGGGHDAPSPSPAPTSRVVAGVSVPVLPLDAYKTGDAQTVIDKASRLLADRCMREVGQKWPAVLEPLGEGHAENERRYGIIDMNTARAYGYQLPPPYSATRAEEEQRLEKEKIRRAGITDAQTDAYLGKGDEEIGGCRGEANQQLGTAPARNGMDPVSELEQRAWAQANADADSRRANADWRACMKKRGYNYPDPHEAAGAFASSASTEVPPPPSRKETAAATADVTCKQEVDYVGRWQKIESGYQNALIARNSARLETYRDAWQDSLAKARKILRES